MGFNSGFKGLNSKTGPQLCLPGGLYNKDAIKCCHKC